MVSQARARSPPEAPGSRASTLRTAYCTPVSPCGRRAVSGPLGPGVDEKTRLEKGHDMYGGQEAQSKLESRCNLLRALHVPGDPLVLPNGWDVASARAVVASGFQVVATTRGVDAPVTVDAEAGYGMDPADLVASLKGIGAAGCNLEDTNHGSGRLRDPA